MRRAASLAALLLAGMAGTDVLGAYIYVSPAGTNNIAERFPDWAGASTSIQAAVDLAVDGDMVWVTNAVYVVNQVDIGAAITLAATNGAGDGVRAVLDGNNAARCFYLHHTGAVIRGFAVIQGRSTALAAGGGGYVNGGTVEDCIISNCVATNSSRAFGGGLWVNNGIVRDSVIMCNTSWCHGAGIYVTNGLVERCSINSNVARTISGVGYGAGAYAGNTVFRDCEFIGNAGALYGGGISARGAGLLDRCLIFTNIAVCAAGADLNSGMLMQNSTCIWNYAWGATGYGGGGIRAANSTVSDCHVAHNVLSLSPAGRTYGGGGIWLLGPAAAALGCRVESNTVGLSGYGNGGGIFMADGLVSNCLISGNLAHRSGGSLGGAGQGVAMLGGLVRDSRIVNNISTTNGALTWVGYYGGGVWMDAGTLLRCSIISNGNTSLGGGVCVSVTNLSLSTNLALVDQCVIENNFAATGGGLLLLGAATNNCIVRNCRITGNQATGSGGGVYLTNGMLEAVTVAGNLAANGGGIWRGLGGAHGVENTIVYNNDATTAGDDIFNPSDTAFSYGCAPELTAGVNGNITNPPLFVDSGSGFGTNALPGDYRLRAASPCINAGVNEAWMETASDLDGNRRLDRMIRHVDMGCFEHMPRGCMFNIR